LAPDPGRAMEAFRSSDSELANFLQKIFYPGFFMFGFRPVLSFPVWSAGQISDSVGENSPAEAIFLG
jgi:hypothetical protein